MNADELADRVAHEMLAAEGTGQWTGCVHDTNRFEPDTGKAIVRRQFWPHAGATLTAGISWR